MSDKKQEQKTQVITADEMTRDEKAKLSKNDGGALILIHGEPQGKKFQLEKEVTTIGRGEECDIQILENGVSRVHTKLVNTAREVVVQDMGSTNGTFLNDTLVTQATLQKDDILGVGVAALKYLPPGSVEIQYHRRMSDAAHTDPLTGINNKGFLMDALENEFANHRNRKAPLSLIIVDLDHFKKVNDTMGHDCGDFVLKEATKVMRNQGVRTSDILGRYGGEEFVVILPDTNLKQAVEIAERLRVGLAAHQYDYEGTPLTVTSSCGVACIKDSMSDHLDLFKLADRAVYQAKNTGRNKVCFPGAQKS